MMKGTTAAGVLFINLTPPDEFPCAMCDVKGDHRYGIPWYCGPVLEGQNHGCYRSVCRRCSLCYDQAVARATGTWDHWTSSRDIA